MGPLRAWLRSAWQRMRNRLPGAAPADVPGALWWPTLARYPFLGGLSLADRQRLRGLVARFLAEKQFHGARGLVVTDAMAVAIAAQACLPLLGWARQAGARRALRLYDDFVGIVVHADEVLARRETVDAAGVVHRYAEVVVGEAMERGPVMLAWSAVADAATASGAGFNVVIHEFAHKLDMRDGAADGCPPLPPGFLDTGSIGAARRHWRALLQPAYEAFRERCIVAERFGGDAPWLDGYAATSPAEFFAVACEAYFVNRAAFAAELPSLLPLFDAYFLRATPTKSAS